MLRRDALSSWLCVWLWLWLTAAWPGAAAARAPSIAERLRDDPDLSQLDGSPPLWVTRRRRPGASEEVYINNALVLAARSNFVTQNAAGKQHVLHVVDEVLTPVTTSATAPAQLQLYNPDAFQFLNQSENFDIGKHRVRSFRQRVYFNKKESVFEALGKFTFFVPVDEGFKPPPRPEKIDQKVIDGHVVPGHVLFTRPTPAGQAYDTLAFGDMLRSDTILGDKSHGNGVVMAEIVHPNIPVKNGVVHLIHRPLMVVDNTVKQFLECYHTLPLSTTSVPESLERCSNEDGEHFEHKKIIVSIVCICNKCNLVYISVQSLLHHSVFNVLHIKMYNKFSGVHLLA
ncbi:Fasciclin-1 [Gryllus bimaculatus]|nr:Fasciclin-1 [Gryllus bimaculatus]